MKMLTAAQPSQTATRIDGNVDPSTGNLDLPGDLEVLGNVVDLFQVRCGGHVRVAGVIEAAEMHVGGDLRADGGISGKAKGICHISGATRARYIANATLESTGDLTVQSEISNSSIVCSGDVKIETGPLLGGQVTIRGSLDCAAIGTSSGTRTTIEIGIDEHLRRLAKTSLPQIDRLKRKALDMRLTAAPMLRVQKTLSSEQKERVTELLFDAETLESEAAELADALRQRYKALQARPEPQVIVSELLHPGVVVRFPGVQFSIDTAIRGPLKLVLRASCGQKYVSLIEDTHQSGYPLPSRPWSDPIMEALIRFLDAA
jgi:uncharacterized protein